MKTAPKTTNAYWWLGLVTGAIGLLVGWYIISNPGLSAVILMQVLGLYWLLVGMVDIVASIFSRSAQHRGWKLAMGVVGVLAGLVVLNSPLLATVVTSAFIVYVIAFSFIFSGIGRMFLGSQTQSGRRRWSWGSLLFGLVLMAIGLVIFGNVALSTLLLLDTVGWLVMFAGVIVIASALMFKNEEVA